MSDNTQHCTTNACGTTPESSGGSCSTSNVDSGNDECCNLPEKLLCLADEAWREVVKEKIKAEIQKISGAKLDKIATLVAATNQARWQNKIEKKQRCNDYQDELRSLLVSK